MDVKPENINPDIVELARKYPFLQGYFNAYLHEIEVDDKPPLTWRDTLELMLLAMARQVQSVTDGWEESASRNEKALAIQDAQVTSPESTQLEVAKGMLAKLISPVRMLWMEKGGRPEEFPPIQLTKSFVEQIFALIGEQNVEKYIQKNPCPVCGNHAWFVEDKQEHCAVCEAGKGKRKLIFRDQQVRMAIAELFSHKLNNIVAVPKRLSQLFPDNFPSEYSESDAHRRKLELEAELEDVNRRLAIE